ncbi:hypothetical protein COY32_01670 [candidate division WWE3 bacterium CG_4_10_14_0_2_um_filter_41_14]|uniref:Uncharacterized protein n=1 Tax=candidate division WWE3 bacterium CG_4_10_14_0_2_um_filter_41_14 TaxID=1975072 RepID=A0A2M7TKQ3_UNCKA|nr:MAG: hypothetical protein COY32_01670 [candidate division WWE3 bacterium CG_4_10_14_0_2_um_filter_41_14]
MSSSVGKTIKFRVMAEVNYFLVWLMKKRLFIILNIFLLLLHARFYYETMSRGPQGFEGNAISMFITILSVVIYGHLIRLYREVEPEVKAIDVTRKNIRIYQVAFVLTAILVFILGLVFQSSIISFLVFFVLDMTSILPIIVWTIIYHGDPKTNRHFTQW